MTERLSDDELARVHRCVAHSLRGQQLEHGDDRELWNSATVRDTTVEHLLNELERLRLVEQLLRVTHWAVDCLWSTSLRPEDFPHTLDELWAYVHAVVDHHETPDAGRINELRQLVDRAYDQQRPGLGTDALE